MESLKMGKVSIGVPNTSVFTFVPVVQKLPSKRVISEEERAGALTENTNQSLAASHEKTATETMSDREVLGAERIFIKDSVEGGPGNGIQTETKLELKPLPDHVSACQTSPWARAQAENTPVAHVAAGTAAMETAVDKHGGIGGVSRQPCHSTSGRAEPHKIKSSYKSLAAIPTNTLLLDQQAIDEQVEREETSDTHAEMCSPAQFRQQSEELYATIDEVLANSIPECKSSRSPQTSRTSTNNERMQNNSFPRSLGRETKYASICSLHPSATVERKKPMDPKTTKPGVIRPMTAIPRLTVEDEEHFHSNPFRQFITKQNIADNKKVEKTTGTHYYTSSKDQTWRDERKPERKTTFSLCDLQIIEPEDQLSGKEVSTSFSPTQRRMEGFETHI